MIKFINFFMINQELKIALISSVMLKRVIKNFDIQSFKKK